MSTEPSIVLRGLDGEVLAEGAEAIRLHESGSPDRPVTSSGETAWRSLDYTGTGRAQGPGRPTGPDRTGADLIGLRGPTPDPEAALDG